MPEYSEILEAIICVGIVMGLFTLSCGIVWVCQKIYDSRKHKPEDIAL